MSNTTTLPKRYQAAEAAGPFDPTQVVDLAIGFNKRTKVSKPLDTKKLDAHFKKERRMVAKRMNDLAAKLKLHNFSFSSVDPLEAHTTSFVVFNNKEVTGSTELLNQFRNTGIPSINFIVDHCRKNCGIKSDIDATWETIEVLMSKDSLASWELGDTFIKLQGLLAKAKSRDGVREIARRVGRGKSFVADLIANSDYWTVDKRVRGYTWYQHQLVRLAIRKGTSKIKTAGVKVPKLLDGQWIDHKELLTEIATVKAGNPNAATDAIMELVQKEISIDDQAKLTKVQPKKKSSAHVTGTELTVTVMGRVVEFHYRDEDADAMRNRKHLLQQLLGAVEAEVAKL